VLLQELDQRCLGLATRHAVIRHPPRPAHARRLVCQRLVSFAFSCVSARRHTVYTRWRAVKSVSRESSEPSVPVSASCRGVRAAGVARCRPRARALLSCNCPSLSSLPCLSTHPPHMQHRQAYAIGRRKVRRAQGTCMPCVCHVHTSTGEQRSASAGAWAQRIARPWPCGTARTLLLDLLSSPPTCPLTRVSTDTHARGATVLNTLLLNTLLLNTLRPTCACTRTRIASATTLHIAHCCYHPHAHCLTLLLPAHPPPLPSSSSPTRLPSVRTLVCTHEHTPTHTRERERERERDTNESGAGPRPKPYTRNPTHETRTPHDTQDEPECGRRDTCHWAVCSQRETTSSCCTMSKAHGRSPGRADQQRLMSSANGIPRSSRISSSGGRPLCRDALHPPAITHTHTHTHTHTQVYTQLCRPTCTDNRCARARASARTHAHTHTRTHT